MKTKTLKHVVAEIDRLRDRIMDVMAIELTNEKEVEESGKGYPYTETGTRKHGAMRRAAHDLKEALTLITQNRDLQ